MVCVVVVILAVCVVLELHEFVCFCAGVIVVVGCLF